MKDECLICGLPLQYLATDTVMECAICHKKEESKTHCISGHYVCNECHTKGIDRIVGICLQETTTNPHVILEKLMAFDFCHMHGPEHHIMVGASLLTAYKNAGGAIHLPEALTEMVARGKKVPGGACGFWGACGAAISTGMFMSIITHSTPLAAKEWGLSNRMTARALDALGKVGGPRCCKRNSFIALIQAVEFAKDELGIIMDKPDIVCHHYTKNNQCLGTKCPFYNPRV